MESSIDNNGIYEVKFEQLVENEKEELNSLDYIMEALMEVSVSIGYTKEKIGKIINYKVGDLIVLDKLVEEELDINVNGKLIASGESMILDNKLAVRLSNVKTEEEN